jgi:hypothetical protein
MVTDHYVRLPENVAVTYDHDFTLEPMNGDVYMVIQNPGTTVTPTRAYIQLSNLFNGDPVLGEWTHSSPGNCAYFSVNHFYTWQTVICTK